MENEETQYISGEGDNFTKYLFSSKPKEKKTIKLELDPPDEGVQIGLHIFQELLMIFTLGMKYMYSQNKGPLNIGTLSNKELETMDQYFQSFGFTVEVNKFTIHDYLSNMKMPNYFKDKHLIKGDTPLKDIYYESLINNHIYRISFDFLM